MLHEIEPLKQQRHFGVLSMFVAACVLLGLLFSTPARAVTEGVFANYFHTSWTQVDGAPGQIKGIAQDADGWLWMVGVSGLYRFDGEHFEAVESIGGHRLHKSNILALAIIDDAIWVGYQFGGVESFGKDGRTNYYPNAVVPGAVSKILKGPDGHVVVATTGGLYQLNAEKAQRLWPTAGALAVAEYPFFLADKSLVFVAGGAVHRRAFGATAFSKVDSDDDKINALLNGPNGALLANTVAAGFLKYDAGVARFRRGAPAGKGELAAYALYFEPDGTPWMPIAGAIQLLSDTTSFVVRDELTRAGGLSGTTVNVQFEDREGNFWLGTDGGLDRIRKNRINSLALPKDVARSAIAAGAPGAVWVGGILNVPLREFSATGILRKTTLTNASVLSSSRDGVTWAASSDTIARYDETGEHLWPMQEEGWSHRVQSIAQDRDGSIWVSRLGHQGVMHFRNGQWETVTHDLGYKTVPIFLFMDGRNRLWQTYTDNRVAVADGNKVTRYTEKDGLRTDNALSLFVSGEHVWVGGEKELMYLLNGKFHALLDKDGKNFIGVSGIVETAKGDLWLNGLQGISHIPAAELQRAARGGDDVRVANERYDAQDGVVGSPVQLAPLPTLVEGADHRIWYSTVQSVGWIDPDHMRRNPTAPHVEVRSLVEGDKNYLSSASAILPAGVENIRIDYTALGLSMPSRMSFRYRLDGIDTDWVAAGNRRSAYYTNLGPGRHHFSVTAANEDGVWNTQGASIEFTVLPTLTQTLWFRLLCFVAVLALLWFLYVLRLRQIIAKNQMRTEVRLGERERIARELHDTLLQSVQGLVLKVHGAAERLPSEEPMRLVLDDAVRNAEDAMVEGRDRVRQLRGGEEVSLALRFRKLEQELASRDGPQFTVSVSAAERALLHDVSRELYAIGREAMLNALNHSNARLVKVDLNCGEGEVSLTVWDDGRGISDELMVAKGRPGHWGVQGMRERAMRIGATFTLLPNEVGGTECSVSVPAPLAYSRAPVPERDSGLWQRLKKMLKLG